MLTDMTTWLKRSGMLIALVLLASCDSDDDSSGDGSTTPASVIVIGTGPAALAAMDTMETNEVPVVMVALEAGDAFGGRMANTVQVNGSPLELGSQRLPAEDAEAKALSVERLREARELIKSWETKSQATTQLQNLENSLIYTAGVAETPEEMGDHWDYFELLLTLIYGAGSPDQSIDDVLKALLPPPDGIRVPLINVMMSMHVEKPLGGDIRKFPSTEINTNLADSMVTRAVTSGMDKILAVPAEGKDIRYQSRVRQIKRLPSGKMQAITEDGKSHEADHILVTVPAPVLKAMKFEPELSAARREALNVMQTGHLEHYFVTFANAFWPADKEFFMVASTDDTEAASSRNNGGFVVFKNMNLVTPGSNMLMTYAAGDTAKAMADKSDAEVMAEMKAKLEDAFPAATIEMQEMTRSNWAANPDALGATAIPTEAARLAVAAFTPEDVTTNLHFAGDYMTADGMGTVAGAVLSGIRAAERIGRAVVHQKDNVPAETQEDM